MANKKSYIKSLGHSTDDVTGSCFLLNYLGDKVLIDCGLRQSSDEIDDYKENIKTLKSIKAKELKAVVTGELHQDHIGLIPALFAKGFNGIVYITKNRKDIMRLMWYDGLKIQTQNKERLGKKSDVSFNPYYSEEDIERCLSHIVEVDFLTPTKITNEISFEYYSANHIVNSAQIVFTLDDGINKRRILYGCDLGNPDRIYPYIDEFQPVSKCDVAIVESTYAAETKTNNKKHRQKDIEKLQSIINQVQDNNCGRIIIPTFSLQRSQDLLTILYETFHNDKDFHLKIVYDAVLGNKISDIWENVIPKNQELWNKVWSWDAIEKVTSWEDSVVWQNTQTPFIVLASGGFLVGRSTAYIQKFLSDKNTYICFCGYSGDETSIAYKIKHSKQFPTIQIDKVKIKNNARIIELHSFSSHIDCVNMLKYYSDIQCTKIYLVHGQMERRIKFKPMLEEEMSKKNKSTRVVIMTNDTKIFL